MHSTRRIAKASSIEISSPVNIILSKTGAKLLDFGLASRPNEMSVEESALTEAKPLTQAGAVMGTPAYMASEQLEGRETDNRTDVFAFGAVLYEMLTGQKASTSDELPTGIPTALARLVERCLAKDPDRRWQSMGDVAYELEWIRDQPPTSAVPQSSRTLERIAWGVGLALAAIAGALSVSWLAPAAEREVVRFTTEEDAVLSAPGQYVKIMPDGRTLLFVGTDEPALSSRPELHRLPARGCGWRERLQHLHVARQSMGRAP